MQKKSPLLVLVPHASGHVPANILSEMLGEGFFDDETRKQRQQHIFNDGDPYTDYIYQVDNAHYLEATVSRFVVDINRERDDTSPNGVIKLTDFSETSLYPATYTLSDEAREQRLRRYHDSFHSEVEAILKSHSVKLIISGHSMATFGPSLSPDKGVPRPAICLMTGGDVDGNDVAGQRNFLGADKARAVKALAEKHFVDVISNSDVPNNVALNTPWSADVLSNTYTNPERHHHPACFGIEFNHALFMNPDKTPIQEHLKLLNTSFKDFSNACLDLVS